MIVRTILTISAIFTASTSALAQQGYEFEVYGTSIPAPRESELELHTNFVPSGSQLIDEAEGRATHRAFKSSAELTTGLTSWLAASVYAVGYARNGSGLEFVGNRLRVTAVVPRSWNLPLDLGLSQEAGYAREGFAEHKWMYEISPIIGKTLGSVSLRINPAFERGLTGEEKEWEFEPRGKLAYSLDDDEELALEYYSVLGPLSAFDERGHQVHQLFATGKTEISSRFEIGAGLGRGLTRDSDKWVVLTRLEFKLP